LAEQDAKISDRPEIGFCGPTLALDGSLFDLEAGEGLRLDSDLVSARLLRLPEISGSAWERQPP
jgi:hypothetical protein